MRCPNCDAKTEGGRYCSHCGEDLEAYEDVEEEVNVDEHKHADVVHRERGPNVIGSVMGKLSKKEASEDLKFGQVVIISARWILVAAGLVLALWLDDPADQSVGDLQIQIALILGLAMANFYLHAQLLMRKPVLEPVAYFASAADIAVISLMVAAMGGFESNLYVFYFPALLALSVSFRTEATFAFTGAAVVAYGLIALVTVGSGDVEFIMTRLLMLVAVGVCGNAYWRIERDRRAGCG